MPFPPRARKLVLTVHLASAVGWMGAAAAFAALDVATVRDVDAATLRAAYVSMDLLARWVLVPLAAAGLASGVAIAAGTTWGLARHYWVLVSLVLTTAAFAVLLAQLPTIAHRADMASDPSTSAADLEGMGHLLLHSVGGTALLALVLVLNVYKPRGLTRRGWRKQRAEAAAGRPAKQET